MMKAVTVLSAPCDQILLSVLKDDQHAHEEIDSHSSSYSELEEMQQTSDVSRG